MTWDAEAKRIVLGLYEVMYVWVYGRSHKSAVILFGGAAVVGGDAAGARTTSASACMQQVSRARRR